MVRSRNFRASAIYRENQETDFVVFKASIYATKIAPTMTIDQLNQKLKSQPHC